MKPCEATHRNLPAHQVRHVPPPPRHKAERADPNYSPGHFTELMRAANWPPMFTAHLGRPVEAWRSELARANRERRVEWGDFGTIMGLTDKATAHPVNQRIAAQMRGRG